MIFNQGSLIPPPPLTNYEIQKYYRHEPRFNSIASKISKALINNEINHEDFMTIINEERNYRELQKTLQ